ncbi:MAG: 50S ribosomal protein L19e [Candidatus Pacearchaeota archaeon]
MKTLSTQKRLAAHVMNIGLEKVWFDPLRLNEIKEAITREDIKALIKEGAIKKRAKTGVKRRAGKTRQKRKRKGRGRGIGRKKIILKKKKREYITKIRSIRRYLKVLKRKGEINYKQEEKLRRLAKAGIIKNVKDITEKIKELKQK